MIRFLRAANFCETFWLCCGINCEFFGFPYLLMKIDETEKSLTTGRFERFTDDVLEYTVTLSVPYSYDDCDIFLSPMVCDLNDWIRDRWTIAVDFEPLHQGQMVVIFGFADLLDATEFKMKWGFSPLPTAEST